MALASRIADESHVGWVIYTRFKEGGPERPLHEHPAKSAWKLEPRDKLTAVVEVSLGLRAIMYRQDGKSYALMFPCLGSRSEAAVRKVNLTLALATAPTARAMHQG